MNQEQKERYVRWQNHRIAQLSFSINLFLGFSVASLAYLINLKLSSENQHQELLTYSIKWWSWSAALGCIATVSRLLDFRYTAKKIKNGGAFNSFMAKWLGPATWSAFWAQLPTYVTGSYFFINGIVGT